MGIYLDNIHNYVCYTRTMSSSSSRYPTPSGHFPTRRFPSRYLARCDISPPPLKKTLRDSYFQYITVLFRSSIIFQDFFNRCYL